MANPPYSGLVMLVRESAEGLTMRVWTWEDLAVDDTPTGLENPPIPPGVVVGMQIPPSPIGLPDALTAATPKPTRHRVLSAATRSSAVTKITGVLTQVFPDTPA